MMSWEEHIVPMTEKFSRAVFTAHFASSTETLKGVP